MESHHVGIQSENQYFFFFFKYFYYPEKEITIRFMACFSCLSAHPFTEMYRKTSNLSRTQTFALKFGLFFSNLDLQKTSNLSRTLTITTSLCKLTRKLKQKAVKNCLHTSLKVPSTSQKVSQHLLEPPLEG